MLYIIYNLSFFLFFVDMKINRVTGISTTMLRNELPLSQVLPKFLDWLATTTSFVCDATHTPIILVSNHALFIILEIIFFKKKPLKF